MSSRSSTYLTLVAALTFTGCAATTSRPASPVQPTAPALAALTRDIDVILGDPVFEHSYWGVLVKSLRTGETVYARNATKLMIPASNMKTVTLAAAAENLGWDYRYQTSLVMTGTVASGTLDGDVIVVGSGDPSLMDAQSGRVFDDWAAQLKALGVQRISGRVVGDDNMFVDDGLGFGWSWDDLPDDYSAPVGALQFNENAVTVTVTPGPAADDFAGIGVVPATSGLSVRSHVTTVASGGAISIDARRLPGSPDLELRGTIPAGHAPVVRALSVGNPTLFFATSLRNALIARGIAVSGAAVDIDDVTDVAAQRSAPLSTYQSAPLSTLAVRLMKDSQNLYAETFLTSMAATAPRSASAGRVTVQSLLAPWGVGPGGLVQRDGSGLSRYDYVSPDALVTVLAHVFRDERLRGPFEASLPVAGRDGTLASRMKGTAAEANARAKTGSMTSVRSVAGYVSTPSGEPLVFAIIANNFDTTTDVINKASDAVIVRLATFAR